MELEPTVCFPLVGRHNETPELLEVELIFLELILLELMLLHCDENLRETFLK